jgi:amino acid transporter
MSVPGQPIPAGPPVSNVTLALARSRLGTIGLMLFVLAAVAPLTVVAGGATTAFAITGSLGIPLSYVVVAFILALFSVGYVAMSRYIVNAGAFYTYIAHGLGRVCGVSASFVAVLAYNLMNVGLYGGFGAVLADLLATRLGVHAAWWVYALGGCAVVALLGVLRVDLNGLVLGVLLLAEITVTLIYDAVQLTHPAGGHLTVGTLSAGHLLDAGVGAAMVVAVAGFVGFEGTAVFSEESKHPKITVPRATLLALTISGLLYGLSAWAMSVATGPDTIVARARTDGTELIFNLVRPYVGQSLLDLGHVLFVTSLFASALAFHNTAARYFYALGREHVLPARLGRTSRRTGAPKVGSLLQSAVAAAVILLYAARGWDPIVRLFFWLTVTAGLGVLILMAATSVAVLVFFARIRHREGVWRTIIAPLLAFLALTGILGLTLQQFATLLGVPPHNALRWQFPAAYLITALAGAGWALILRTTRPTVYHAIGLGANSTTATTVAAPMSPPAAPKHTSHV